LQIGRVQVSEANESGPVAAPPVTYSTSPLGDTGTLTAQFQMRREHFTRALDELSARYTALNATNEAQRKQEEGRQRMLEMAADYGPGGKKQLRGFRGWLARLFGFA